MPKKYGVSTIGYLRDRQNVVALIFVTEPSVFKDILLNLECDEALDGVRDYAISLAELFDAHLTAVALSGVQIPSVMMPDFPTVILERMADSSGAEARSAIERFRRGKGDRMSKRHHAFVSNPAEPLEAFAVMARRFDLSVIGQVYPESTDTANQDLIEATLFRSGRPLMIVPSFHAGALRINHITCCWDGSRVATRALHDALPILQNAKSVELLIVSDDGSKKASDARGANIAEHISHHGIVANIEVRPAPDTNVAEAILSHVADCSSDMIVMGGYGHSHLREFLLGGVTREIMRAMTVPVLISH